MNTQTKIEALPVQIGTPQMALVGALAKALPALGAVNKNKANPAFKSHYADLAAVISALAPLADYGLWFRQVPVDCDNGLAIETFYIHESGAEMSAGVTVVPVDRNNAQGHGSAQTYCRRYALMTAFGLAADDDDGNAAAKAAPTAKAKAAPEQIAKQPKHSALRTAYRGFVHELNGCGDADELNAFLSSADSVKLVAEVREKLPHIWDGENWPEGSERPDEWEPLADFISRRQRECAERTAQYMTV